MEAIATAMPDVLLVEPKVFGDAQRVLFRELERAGILCRMAINARILCRTTIRGPAANVVRGLHYQIRQPQGKLVRAMRRGAFSTSLVDIRRSSPTLRSMKVGSSSLR
jgi:dTDP-4-dehydrorhamnose 3,5-epimerase